MGFSLKRKNSGGGAGKPDVKKPSGGFRSKFIQGQSGSESTSDESDDDDEASFARSVLARRQKINQQLESSSSDQYDAVMNNEGRKQDTQEKSTESKYIAKLLHAKRKREQDHLESQERVRDRDLEKILTKNHDLEVFETKEYKQQRIRQKNAKEDHNEEPRSAGDSALFYSKLIDARMGKAAFSDGSDDNIDENKNEGAGADANNNKVNVDANENNNEDIADADNAEGNANVPQIPSISRQAGTTKSTQESDLMAKLREMCRSKISEAELAGYKKRFWQRRREARV